MCIKHSQGAPEPALPFTSLLLDPPNDRGVDAALVNTVLGPVDARQLGITLLSESLMYVLPGAQYAYDIRIDRAEVFDAIASKLRAFKAAGGGTIVDATGMFQGRDLRLYEALSRVTGVHIVASTGQGPEAMLGGYFLTPQTNPPAPWPAAKFAEMFGREVNEGMVVPRLERRAPAGMVATAVTHSGMTPTDGSLVRGAARAGSTYGVPVFIRCGADALEEMQLAIDEVLSPDRLVMGGMDRRDAIAKGWPMAVARAGARVGVDHVGSTDALYLKDAERVALILELIEAGFADRIILSSSATGVAFGESGNNLPYCDVLTKFVPMLQAAGVSQEHIVQMLIVNTAQLLSVNGEVK
ncbi:phosphotriesterase [Paraburkholderia pallida]|uniref:Phosphotriesterase n=1 Tax=Paraburkholderia pallida TaxID=2547399 RepID=A0A4P7CZC0_9BURK|nr:phosphotriesterase [Paraburkholderia pallida]QBQ99471.1 phosphotriesterase [Paraburkholderia pallida]